MRYQLAESEIPPIAKERCGMQSSLTFERVEMGYRGNGEGEVQEELGIFILLTAFIHQHH